MLATVSPMTAPRKEAAVRPTPPEFKDPVVEEFLKRAPMTEDLQRALEDYRSAYRTLDDYYQLMRRIAPFDDHPDYCTAMTACRALTTYWERHYALAYTRAVEALERDIMRYLGRAVKSLAAGIVEVPEVDPGLTDMIMGMVRADEVAKRGLRVAKSLGH